MHLENMYYSIDINEDKTYTLQSSDNAYYDNILNPNNYTRNDYVRVLKIEVKDKNDKIKIIGLVGDIYIFDYNCAVLEENRLIVLMDRNITVIDLERMAIVNNKSINSTGCNLAIFKIDYGYVIYGEVEIIKLDELLNEEWVFSGKDIFVTKDGDIPFTIENNKIKLHDWNNTYYELDMNGNLICVN